MPEAKRGGMEDRPSLSLTEVLEHLLWARHLWDS